MTINVPNLPYVPDLESVNRTLGSFHICGETVWIVNLWKQHWREVAVGEAELNPRIVFKNQTVLGEYVN